MLAEQDIALPGESREDDPSSPSERSRRISDIIREFASFSELLRMAGAGFVVASLSVFLLQGWADGNDIARFYKLLSMSGLLLAGGFGLSYLLSDQKGARVFFGLGMVSVPAIASVLGALLYSLFGTPLSVYPAFAQWVTPDASGVLLAASAALAVAAPATLFGTRIMARRSSRAISTVFVGLNMLLLIPVRDPLLIAALVGAVALGLTWFVPRQFACDDTLKTPGGRFAMSMLFVPLGILVIRNLFLYGLDEALTLVTSVSVYLALRQLEKQCDQGTWLRAIVSLATVPVALIAAASLFVLTPSTFGWEWKYMAFNALLGTYLWDRIRRHFKAFIPGLIVLFTGGVIAASSLIHAVAAGTAGGLILGIATAGMLTGMGFKARNLLLVYLGAATALGSVATGFDDLVALFFNAGWISLAVLGFLAIVGASLVERYGALVRVKLANWRRQQLSTGVGETKSEEAPMA